MKWITINTVFLISVLLCSLARAGAGTKAYVLVIGNNAPPPETSLDDLRFADDDAVRYFHFFSRFADYVLLMTVPDKRTQMKYPDIASKAIPPNRINFENSIKEISAKIKKARRDGYETVFYMMYSGHGDHNEVGDAYMTLLDGGITNSVLYDALATIAADYTHLFIDACYAEGVVDFRGPFGTETGGRRVPLSDEIIKKIIGKDRTLLPGVGIVVAASEYEQTHEWSEIESGIFTHEVLSGLSGPADINLDGKIEYSELTAFIVAANRNVRDVRGRLKVVGKPPFRNENVPIVDLETLPDAAFLTENPSSLGHFFIELDTGERYLDANLGDMKRTIVMIPADRIVYLHSNKKVATLKIRPNSMIDLATLTYAPQPLRERGSIDIALRKGLFTAAYGIRYYNGFIDSMDFVSVRFDEPRFRLNRPQTSGRFWDDISRRRRFAAVGFGVAGGAVVAAIAFGAMSLDAKKDFESTEYHRPSVEANETFKVYSGLFWGSVGLASLGVMVGGLLLPWRGDKHKQNIALRAGDDNALSIGIGF